MFLFKASGATYSKVAKQEVHAFPFSPADVSQDEFVLLSKNREDCGLLEKQVQHVAKILAVRDGTDAELDALFPGVRASDRWSIVVQLYWRKPLLIPFNLSQVPDFNYKRYNPVQGFAKIDHEDQLALVRFLADTNEAVVLDFMNNAERPAGW